MNHHYTLLLTLLFCNNFVVGMETENNQEKILLQMTSDVKKKYNISHLQMSDIKPENQPWWYLDQKIDHQSKIQSVCFNFNNTNLLINSYDKNSYDKKTTIFNLASQKITGDFEFSGENPARIRAIDPYGEFYAFHLNVWGPYADHKVYIKYKDYDKTIELSHPEILGDICLDSTGSMLATTSENTARIFKQYDNYTLEQLQLKQAMNTWLLIQKPVLIIKKNDNQEIVLQDILAALLKDIADKQILVPNLDQLTIESELKRIWETFPTGMQQAILRTMEYKIKRFGKIQIL